MRISVLLRRKIIADVFVQYGYDKSFQYLNKPAESMYSKTSLTRTTVNCSSTVNYSSQSVYTGRWLTNSEKMVSANQRSYSVHLTYISTAAAVAETHFAEDGIYCCAS